MAASQINYDKVEVGTELPTWTFQLTRADLVRYAGASGDFNPIHWNDRFAVSVGLPDVIAHGMLTMAKAGRIVTDWVGDPGAVLEYGVRFTKPVTVPNDDDGTELVVEARVTDKLEDRRVRIDLVARCEGAKVLGASRAIVQLV